MNYNQQLKTSAKKLSRDMRKLPTKAEKLLWDELRNRKLGDKK